MPPRHAYWTIIFGGQPTSFRAATPEELLPTLKQIRSKHPDAVMLWFARGKLWPSPEEAREHQRRGGRRPWGERAGESQRRGPSDQDKPRGRGWRPGGQHKDPRERFNVPRDVKRARFAARLRRDRLAPRPPRKKDDDK